MISCGRDGHARPDLDPSKITVLATNRDATSFWQEAACTSSTQPGPSKIADRYAKQESNQRDSNLIPCLQSDGKRLAERR